MEPNVFYFYFPFSICTRMVYGLKFYTYISLKRYLNITKVLSDRILFHSLNGRNISSLVVPKIMMSRMIWNLLRSFWKHFFCTKKGDWDCCFQHQKSFKCLPWTPLGLSGYVLLDPPGTQQKRSRPVLLCGTSSCKPGGGLNGILPGLLQWFPAT